MRAPQVKRQLTLVPIAAISFTLARAQDAPSLTLSSNSSSFSAAPGCTKPYFVRGIAAYNFARRLKTLRGLTPYEAICRLWTHDADRFTLDSIHQIPGLNTSSAMGRSSRA
jgi:hypothetical protein